MTNAVPAPSPRQPDLILLPEAGAARPLIDAFQRRITYLRL
jgi:hypothetical protein